MKIEKKTISKKREVVSKPAYYKDVDTGNKKMITILLEDGTSRQEERPIINKVLVEAEKIIKEEKQEIYEVNDGVDTHTFTSLKDAEDFLRG